MRRKRRQSTGAISLANSFRNQVGIRSGPEALPVFKEASTLRTLRVDKIGVGIGLARGRVVGTEALESSRDELAEKREPKRVALSVGVQAIEPSGRIRGGKLDLQKLLRILLAKDQKFFSVGEEFRISVFLLTKENFLLRSVEVQRFLAELKEE